MEEAVIENHKKYLERKALYKSFGYDVDKERAYIIEKAQPLYGKILEAGTGKGHFALALAREGCRFTTFDISEEEQDFARFNLKYFKLDSLVDFCIENGEQLSFKDRSFDIIFSVNTLHHLFNPYKVIDEFIRVFSFKGKVILSDFTKEGLEVMSKIHASEGREHEVSNVTLAHIENYLRSKSFIIEKNRGKFQEVLVAHSQIIKKNYEARQYS